MNILFICEDIKEKVKIFFSGDRKTVFQFKMSATMVGHLENFGHLEKYIFDHNFVTNCDINTNIVLNNIYSSIFNCNLIRLFLIVSENKWLRYFKNGV